MELYEQLIGFARAYPLIISMSCFITYFLTNNIDLLLLTGFILLNDSVNHFLSGALYFETKPNYDSTLPAISYIQKDIMRFIESLRWK